jgi:uncharacterized protein
MPHLHPSLIATSLLIALPLSCHAQEPAELSPAERSRARLADPATPPCLLITAALDQTLQHVRYDPAYVVIEYPGGDVPLDTGVCTDVIIRAFRSAFSVDLQKLVHEDMRAHFASYPKLWGLSRPDRNIDHRRVPNLQRFLTRQEASLPISDKPASYLPGDLVAWDLNDKGLWHIGILAPDPAGGDRPWVVHNIGRGPELSDCLFSYTIVGHYRFHPEPEEPASPSTSE